VCEKKNVRARTHNLNMVGIACVCVSVFGWIFDALYHVLYLAYMCISTFVYTRGWGLGSRPKKMYGERLGDGAEYHLMKRTPPSLSTIYNGA